MEPIYLDHHSTTPCDPRVVERMLPFFSGTFGNPASIVHAHGRQAATAVEEARNMVAGFIGARSNEIYFTAGATESNNIVIQALGRERGRHIVTTALEHSSVRVPVERLIREGVEVTLLRPDRFGFVTAAQVREALRPDTSLVSVISASGEIGTLEPVEEIGAVCRDAGVPFHCDATQAYGKVPIDVSVIGCDALSLSAHKVYGPKGIGALYVRRGVRITPLVVGGGQEKNVRSGTVNVTGAVGLAAATELRRDEMGEEARRLTALRNQLWDRLVASIDGTAVAGPRDLRLPGNLNVRFAHVDAEALIYALRRFSLSAGSACSSGSREPSAVLLSIGLSDEEALSSIRIGLGHSTTGSDIDLLAEDLMATIPKLRSMSIGSTERQ